MDSVLLCITGRKIVTILFYKISTIDSGELLTATAPTNFIYFLVRSWA